MLRACFTSICTTQELVKRLLLHTSALPLIQPIPPLIYLHLSDSLGFGLAVSVYLDHLLSQPLHLVVQLGVGAQQVLVVHQQAAHFKPSHRRWSISHLHIHLLSIIFFGVNSRMGKKEEVEELVLGQIQM